MTSPKYLVEHTSKKYLIELDHWSHSQDSSFRRCKLKWFRQAVLGWRSKVQPIFFERGNSIHHALEQFHSIDPKDRSMEILIHYFNEYRFKRVGELSGQEGVNPESIKEFEDWCDKIGLDTINEIWHTYEEDEDIPKLSFPEYEDIAEIEGIDVPYKYRLDLLGISSVPPFIMETKTMAFDYRKDLDIHDLQSPRNIWAINKSLNLPNPIKTIIYNFVVFPTKTRHTILQRKKVTPTDAEVLYAIGDLANVIKEAIRPDLQIYPSFSIKCKHEKCEFYQLCLQEKIGNGDIDTIVDAEFTERPDKPGKVLEIK